MLEELHLKSPAASELPSGSVKVTGIVDVRPRWREVSLMQTVANTVYVVDADATKFGSFVASTRRRCELGITNISLARWLA